MRVLIGYASRFGSTRDVAMRIADTIRTHGNEVAVGTFCVRVADTEGLSAPTTFTIRVIHP